MTNRAVFFLLVILIGAGGAVGQAGLVRDEDCQRYGFSGVSWKHGDWDWWEFQPRWCASYYDDGDGDGIGALNTELSVA